MRFRAVYYKEIHTRATFFLYLQRECFSSLLQYMMTGLYDENMLVPSSENGREFLQGKWLLAISENR